MEGGGRRVEGGGWRKEGEGWRVEEGGEGGGRREEGGGMFHFAVVLGRTRLNAFSSQVNEFT